jgi:hypothetical protein
MALGRRARLGHDRGDELRQLVAEHEEARPSARSSSRPTGRGHTLQEVCGLRAVIGKLISLLNLSNRTVGNVLPYRNWLD